MYLGEFGTHVQTNSNGFRGREHDVGKKDGGLQILLLGDSFMEALQVEFQDAFPSLLERQLTTIMKTELLSKQSELPLFRYALKPMVINLAESRQCKESASRRPDVIRRMNDGGAYGRGLYSRGPTLGGGLFPGMGAPDEDSKYRFLNYRKS